MLYKLSVLALVGATYALPNAPAYGAAAPPAYGASSSSSKPPVSPSSKPVSSSTEAPKYSTTSAGSQPTASCPAAGTSDSHGRYSCNPAHSYPAGQTCKLIDGCYFIDSGSASMPAAYPSASSTAPAAYPTSSSACPAPGTNDSQGRYSCNPARTYPEGQTCKLIDGCYLLEYPKTSTGSVTKPAAYPTSSTGQTCTLINGCYLLETPKTSSTVPAAYPTSSSSACPASGAKDSQGRYSCNPAHTYPEGQTCKLINGCYLLETSSSTVPAAASSTKASPPAYKPSSTAPAAYASSTPVAPPAYGASSTPVAPPAYGASSTTPAGPASYPAPTAY
ncbi:uncharacterized protein SEPMUDRAFT_81774 [Sphaerulina musiva SO2202]|uniref:Uncharacterized protein n=1 Tax=Sphaerulina musiva (strain SO2202) TaxID=692275 RepID=M3D746_SPHMS|nr:uncharacterized protein SEPMUDRAFT_81774 [Sphaerulina musiva SO2202]EMF13975.1 hypothetical protein SEPMUDRAFT_81774 [Sphaerulina musiva SO2202]